MKFGGPKTYYISVSVFTKTSQMTKILCKINARAWIDSVFYKGEIFENRVLFLKMDDSDDTTMNIVEWREHYLFVWDLHFVDGIDEKRNKNYF